MPRQAGEMQVSVFFLLMTSLVPPECTGLFNLYYSECKFVIKKIVKKISIDRDGCWVISGLRNVIPAESGAVSIPERDFFPPQSPSGTGNCNPRG